MPRLFGQQLRSPIAAAVFLAIAALAALGQSGTNQSASTQSSAAPSSTRQSSAAQSSSTQSSPTQSSPSQSPAGSATSNQSLGEIARENRAQKEDAAFAVTPGKVITNADLPKNPDGYTGPPASEAAPGSNQKSGRVSGNAGARKAAGAPPPLDPRVAATWRGRILAQKAVIANLEGQIEDLRTAMEDLNPGRGDPGANGSAVAFSPGEARRAARLHQMELRLEQLQQRLDETEDAARRAGMDSKVFDP